MIFLGGGGERACGGGGQEMNTLGDEAFGEHFCWVTAK